MHLHRVCRCMGIAAIGRKASPFAHRRLTATLNQVPNRSTPAAPLAVPTKQKKSMRLATPNSVKESVLPSVPGTQDWV